MPAPLAAQGIEKAVFLIAGKERPGWYCPSLRNRNARAFPVRHATCRIRLDWSGAISTTSVFANPSCISAMGEMRRIPAGSGLLSCGVP